MKKFIAVIASVLLSLTVLVGCQKSMEDVIETEASFTGTVETICNGSAIVNVNRDDKMYSEFSVIEVSLSAEQQDSYTDLKEGDEIVVYYDSITKDTIAKVDKVLAITLKTPSDRTESES